MRNRYKEVLKTYFQRQLRYTRVEVLGITQEEMAQRLALACRSYVDLERSKTTCSAVTLVLFLLYLCEDPTKFLKEMRCAFDSVSAKAS